MIGTKLLSVIIRINIFLVKSETGIVCFLQSMGIIGITDNEKEIYIHEMDKKIKELLIIYESCLQKCSRGS